MLIPLLTLLIKVIILHRLLLRARVIEKTKRDLQMDEINRFENLENEGVI